MRIKNPDELEFDAFCKRFDIHGSTKSYIDIEAFFDKSLKKELNNNGYVILRNVVSLEILEEIRKYWLKPDIHNSRNQFLFYGRENFRYNFFGKYIRYFDFYWNPPTHKKSYDLSLLLHFGRNLITGFNPYVGLSFSPKKEAIYLALTHYPIGSGEMAVHVDPNNFLPVHYNLPLTHKGLDYETGGLVVYRGEEHVDIDSKMKPGDLLLFSGSVPHEIERVGGKGRRSNLGRLQMFAVPTSFGKKTAFGVTKSIIKDLYGRLKYTGYRWGIGLKSDHKNFR